MRALARPFAATAGLLLLAAGCGSGSSSGTEPVTLQVYAAASLQEPFAEIGEEFEAAHEGVEVAFNLAGSSTLVQQIRQCAPADVFASANPQNMDTLVEAHLAAPVDFTSNTLMIAVPPGNPAGITDLASLTRDGLHLVLCATEVPCGAAAETLEESAGLTFAPVSEEQSVTDVLNKVTSGQADAGLVYVTDIARAGDAAEGIEFPEAQDAVNTYPITPIRGADHAGLGEEFVDLVLSEPGQQILADHGFVGP